MMMTHVLNLLLLFLVLAPSISQSFNPCLYNREDILPCVDYFNTGVVSPGTNQYTVHATRFQRNPATGGPLCIKRKEGELLQDVEDLGTPQVKFLFSPGAEQSPAANYVNQMLVEYNITCETGQPAFIQFEDLNLETKNCDLKCRDYIEINTGTGGTQEYCGSSLPSDPFVVGTGHFTLKLRTSFYSSFPGFRVFVTCVSAEDIDPDNCTDYGGSSRKRAVTQLVNLAPVQPELNLKGELSIIKKPPPLTLTSAQKKTLHSMAESLFNVALSQARRKITSWPPRSYSQNEPNDIRSLSELNSPTPTRPPATLRPISLPPLISLPPPPPIDIFIDPPEHVLLPVEPSLQPRRKRLSIAGRLADTVQLSSRATMDAVRNENTCNPIVRSVTSSYLTIAQRLEPTQLQSARQEFEQELAALRQSQDSLVLPREEVVQLPNQPQLQFH